MPRLLYADLCIHIRVAKCMPAVCMLVIMFDMCMYSCGWLFVCFVVPVLLTHIKLHPILYVCLPVRLPVCMPLCMPVSQCV